MTAFRKYHGLGNDFVLLDNRGSSTPLLTPSQSAAVCHRHTGIGADGVIFLLPAANTGSDYAMRLHNADGSEPEMCGNGIRCLARFAADLGVAPREGRFVVDTGAGVIVPELLPAGLVRVDMGVPELVPGNIPASLDTGKDVGWTDGLVAAGREWNVTPVSMGNPHAVIFVTEEEFSELDRTLETVGPQFENHVAFPHRTNTEFIYARSALKLDMLVWERGSGRTLACGTGACATVVAAVLTGRAARDTPVVVHLPGGDLSIEWTSAGRVLMTGPAELVFEGTLPSP